MEGGKKKKEWKEKAGVEDASPLNITRSHFSQKKGSLQH